MDRVLPCRLGVNIDHFATLRNARKEGFPSIVLAATKAIDAGADMVVCHLREDRRHINDEDLYLLKKVVQKDLDLEMALRDDVINISLDVKPDKVTIVPEKREEVTTEGGLDVKKHFDQLKDLVKEYKKNNIETFLFIEPDIEVIELCAKLEVDGIELHTGKYSRAKGKNVIHEYKRIKIAGEKGKESGLLVAAGHGLDYQNTPLIVSIPEIFELNIGFSIISHSLFVGFENAVRQMKEIIIASRFN
ncbi:MAG: pyridoxine 5'-phosphate synthase [Exilispira sp.]